MNALAALSTLLTIAVVQTSAHPHLYNPYYNLIRYSDNYYPQVRYTPLVHSNYLQDPILAAYVSTPNELPTLNILAETPYQIKKEFSVVPMLVVAKENMNMVSNGAIMGVSKRKPIMTVKTKEHLLQCTPAVKINLKTPIVLYSLKSSIIFPAEIDIVHERYSIPIRVGAVIAPVPHDTFVSTNTPISISVVYAVPTRPIKIDYVNNQDAQLSNDNQAIVVDSYPVREPQNVTFIDFPEKLAEPNLEVDEEDAELDYRQPQVVLAPAGIASSSQPNTYVGPFHNSKESPVLASIREEALKHRVY